MRRSYHSPEVKGEVMLFDSLINMAKETAQSQKSLPANARCRISPSQSGEGWTGHAAVSWDEVPNVASESWATAKDHVQSIISTLVEGDTLPRPKNRKRVRRYNELDGSELSLDRLQAGHDWWEDAQRDVRRGPTTITVLTNLDAGCSTGPHSVFWRGAAAIAATDLLEQAGYMVELIMWCHGTSVYSHPRDHQLTLLRLKEAGQPLDMQALCCGLSAWFLRVVVFGSFHLATRSPNSIGCLSYNLEPKHVNCMETEGAIVVRIPPQTYGLDGAVKAARDAIVKVIMRNEGALHSDDDQGGYETLQKQQEEYADNDEDLYKDYDHDW